MSNLQQDLNKLTEKMINILERHFTDLTQLPCIDANDKMLDVKLLDSKSYDAQYEANNTASWGQNFIRILGIEPQNVDLKSAQEADCSNMSQKDKEDILEATIKSYYKERSKILKKAFNKIPPMARKFQEIFTTVDEFRIHEANYMDTNSKHNVPLKLYVFASPVSPELFTDTLAENLGLCDFSDCKGDPMKRLEMKSDPKVIAALKLIYLGLKPIGFKYSGRLYRLTQVSSKDEEVNKILAKYNQTCIGKIAMIKFTGYEEKAFKDSDSFEIKRKGISIYKNFQDAQRALQAMDQSYIKESENLMRISVRIEELGEKLSNWKTSSSDFYKDDASSSIISECEEISQELRNSINKFKVSAKELIDQLAEAQKERNNPRAYLLILSAVLRRINERFAETNAIMMRETSNERWLKNINRNIEFKLDTLSEKVDDWKKFLKNCRKIYEPSKEPIKFTFTYSINNLSQIEDMPYNQIAKNLQNASDRIIQIVDNDGTLEDLNSQLDYMKFILNLEHNAIRLLNKALSPSNPLVLTRYHITKLMEALKNDIDNPDIDKKYIDFYTNLLESITNLNQNIDLDLGNDQKYVKYIRDSIKEVLTMVYDKLCEA